MIYDRQIREARATLERRVLQKHSSVDAAVIGRTECVDGTPSVTLVQAGLIQQVFEQAEFGRRAGADGGGQGRGLLLKGIECCAPAHGGYAARASFPSYRAW